jgi:hypothetical protein
MEKREKKETGPHVPPEGICLCATTTGAVARAQAQCEAWLQALGLQEHTIARGGEHKGQPCVHVQLRPELASAWMPDHNTLALHETLALDSLNHPDDLEREIVVAMLRAPQPFVFPDADELASCVRMRAAIVRAARRTALAFDTHAAERPEDCWRYHEDTGFTLVPGHRLVDALVKATQPEATGRLYSFSCYRATEYVILLAIAQELATHNPALLETLTRHCEHKAIRSGAFHDTFLYEYGSAESPLPPGYYVPGDRLWFRNPDSRSADVAGFEGSWVFYLGNGLFSNFWKRDQPFTLESKCVEIYHWRDGVTEGPGEEPQLDETRVESLVQKTRADAAALQRVMATMLRLRDPKGVDAGGGCIDTSREYPRHVRPGTADIVLPRL